MYKVSYKTVRPNTNVPFFSSTEQGQEYDKILAEARNTLPTSEDQENALVAFNRVESPDGLTLTTTYVYMSSVGKNAFDNTVDTLLIAKDMRGFKVVRDEYNLANNLTTTIEVEII